LTMPCPQPHSRLPENNAMAPEAVCFPARSAVHLGSPRSIHLQRRRSRAPPIAPCAAERTHETSERRRTLDVRIASQTRGRSQTDRDGHTWGFDHGVGHPLLLLCDAKAPNFRKNKAFKDLSHYAEWPKVADAVIEAVEGFSTAYIWQRRQGGNKQEIGHAYRVAYGWGNPATGIEHDHLIRLPQWGECPSPGVFSPLEGEDGNLRHRLGPGLSPLKR
jgi:hypothetical protein